MAGKLFVVVGAGGAGKALAYGAKEKGARVVIANRTYGEILASQCILLLSMLNSPLNVRWRPSSMVWMSGNLKLCL